MTRRLPFVRAGEFFHLARWPTYIIASVGNTKFRLVPLLHKGRQHHSFFDNYSLQCLSCLDPFLQSKSVESLANRKQRIKVRLVLPGWIIVPLIEFSFGLKRSFKRSNFKPWKCNDLKIFISSLVSCRCVTNSLRIKYRWKPEKVLFS